MQKFSLKEAADTLSDVADSEEYFRFYYDRQENEFSNISQEDVNDIDDDDYDETEFDPDLVEWINSSAVADERYIMIQKDDLPDSYQVRVDFADEINNQTLQGILQRARPYRHFLDYVQKHDLANRWYAYEAAGYAQAARDWARGYDLQYQEDMQ
ncbi:hypothetical protein [Lapidilactobacillus gannanensis]|nr:hypothetical protein [Lactobacillaceae bacterium]